VGFIRKSRWRGLFGQANAHGGLCTFTIITGGSSGVSADIHDRMPVWLQPGQVDNRMAAERRHGA
jgi:putative SOS response-associated peptidase YedK